VCSLSLRKGDKIMPTMQAWANFIAEYKLDIEMTAFNIDSKHHYFVRVGSFDASRHPAKMPIHYWRDQNNKNLSPPKLQMNKLTAILTERVGSMGISFNDSLSNNAEDLNENIGMDSNVESVGPSIEQLIEIRNKEYVCVSFFHTSYCLMSS
jgi:hypothetical protein